jgi:hypothetical protein
MKKFFNYFLLVSVCCLCLTCKKKTSVHVRLLNPALNEYVPGATIVLVERHLNGKGISSCEEIATAKTDSNGECEFEKEKMKSRKNYEYYCAVKESWGLQQNYPCEGKTSRFLKKGKSQDWLMTDYVDGNMRVQYNNLLSPSQPGDSLIVGISTTDYYDPIAGVNQGGGGVFGAFPFYGCNGFPFPPVVTLTPIKTLAGKKTVITRKRKMGIVSTSTDTVKVYPNQTTTVEINW